MNHAIYSLSLSVLISSLSAGQPSTLATPDKSPPAPPGAQTTHQRGYIFLDANADGKIDPGEFAFGQQTAYVISQLLWDECDPNADGSVDVDEFAKAALKVVQALLQDRAQEEQAESALAQAVPLRSIIENLSSEEEYADEIKALREEISDLNDDEEVVVRVFNNPDRYPHLNPVLRTWVRHYPVKPALHRYRAYRKPVASGGVSPKAKAPVRTPTPAAQPPRPKSPKPPAPKPPSARPAPKHKPAKPQKAPRPRR